MKSKEWRWLPGYEGVYEVCEDGRIRRVDKHPQSICFRGKRGNVLSEGRNAAGYRHVVLCYKGKKKTIGVHRAVALAFHGPPPPRHECAHLDGRPSNCHKDNLKWVTRRDNHFHKRAHGTHRCGEQMRHIVKLTAAKVRKIVAIQDTDSQTAIGRMFGVSQTCVAHILHGRTWTHVTGYRLVAKNEAPAPRK